MKVKEIVEILKIPQEELITKLSNVGIEADLETDIAADIIKKLSKIYKVDIKPAKKIKKEEPKPTVEEPKVEIKEEVKEEPKVVEPEPPQQAKEKEPIKEVPEKQKTKETPKKPEVIKDVKKEEPVEVDVELSRVYDDTYTDYEEEGRVYTRLKNVKKQKIRKGSRQSNVGTSQSKNVLTYIPGMTVAQIADGLDISIGEIVKKLIDLGIMASATHVIDREAIELLAEDSGFILKDKVIEDITKFEQIVIEDEAQNLVSRPPIVTIMGHVDHGKTTLLDTIRNAKVAEGEAGGITQHIGAYQVRKNDRLITFIDTPGHAAFTEMRARGANATDIVILVVAADDGVMPQTKEAIEHAQAAKVPIIVAINKMDKPSANPDRVKQELTAYNLLSEEWGGKTIFVPISALKGQGVEELLEMVLLVADIEDLKANPNRLAVGTVIEAKLDKGRGPVATLLVKNGTIKIGDPVVVGNTYAKIRAMQDENNRVLTSAGPSKAVEVTGLEHVPQAGDYFMVFDDEKTAKLVAEERTQRQFEQDKGVGKSVSLASLFDALDDSQKELNLIIKGDVQGSIEALRGSLEKLNVEGAKINIVRAGAGGITETDVSLAVASQSVILAFNVRPSAKILEYAREKEIEVRTYNIIYKVLEDIEAAMKGMLDPVFEEKIMGEAEIRTIFKASKIGTIAGSYVTSGIITRASDIRLIRDSVVIYEGKISSLKRFKEDVREVRTGYECGITIENYNDVKEGDVIEAYKMVKVK
jgi:translation initiation factor IF-2